MFDASIPYLRGYRCGVSAGIVNPFHVLWTIWREKRRGCRSTNRKQSNGLTHIVSNGKLLKFIRSSLCHRKKYSLAASNFPSTFHARALACVCEYLVINRFATFWRFGFYRGLTDIDERTMWMDGRRGSNVRCTKETGSGYQSTCSDVVCYPVSSVTRIYNDPGKIRQWALICAVLSLWLKILKKMY